MSNVEYGLDLRSLIGGYKNLAELVSICFNILISCVALNCHGGGLRGYCKLCALYLNIVSTCRVDLLLDEVRIIAGDARCARAETDAVDSCVDYPSGL